MFPTGIPGTGLLVLRLSVVAGLLLEDSGHGVAANGRWHMVFWMVPAAGLCLGLLTPWCAVLALLMESTVILTGQGIGNGQVIGTMGATAAIAMVGPGAHSIDARIFGRRRLKVPSRS